MARYRILEQTAGKTTRYVVQKKFLFFWIKEGQYIRGGEDNQLLEKCVTLFHTLSDAKKYITDLRGKDYIEQKVYTNIYY